MKPSEIMLDFGRPVAYYPGLCKKLGGVKATVFFCQLFYWHGKQSDRNYWINKTQDEIEEETGLSTREQVSARSELRQRDLLEEKENRLEHKMYYRIKIAELDKLLSEKPLNQPGSTNRISGIDESHLVNSNTESTIINNTPQPRAVVKSYDPDLKEELNPSTKTAKGVKPVKKIDPGLYPWAKEIALLCSLSLGNGSDGVIFSAAKLVVNCVGAPKAPLDLRQYFAKGGAIYKEYPWSGNGLLKPMDIPKHWPRLSGAIIPPSVKSKSRAREEC
jgi:hypothetical protein